MFVTLRGRALARRRRPAFPRCSSSAWLVCLGALLGQTCGALPPIPFVGPDPANPDAPAPPSSYRSVISPYSSLRPAKPGGWLQQNQRAASQGGMSGMQMHGMETPGTEMPAMDHSGHQGHQP